MSSEQFDDLAAHFMSGPGPISPGGGSASGRSGRPPAAVFSPAPVTLVVCGNLPNLAGVWVSYFADRIARTTGPVALVRMESQSVRAEVIRPGGRAVAPGAGWLASVQRFATRWMIGVGERATPAEIIASGKPIDFLTGVDEAALAAAKFRIGALVTAAREAAAPDPRINITAVGAKEDLASATAAQLAGWARNELGVELTCAAALPPVDRIEVGGSGELAELAHQSLAAVIESCLSVSATPNRAAESEVAWRAAKPAPLMRPAAAPPRPVGPLPSFAPAPKFTPPATPAPAPLPSFAPAPAASSAPVPAAQDDLALWFEELTSIAFRPPVSPTVTLAFDAGGQLHLLARESSLDALHKARVWAQQHWPLLRAAQPTLGATAQIIEHIMLDRAADGARLHGLGVRLHALVHIRVDGLEVRRRIDLNDETTAG